MDAARQCVGSAVMNRFNDLLSWAVQEDSRVESSLTTCNSSTRAGANIQIPQRWERMTDWACQRGERRNADVLVLIQEFLVQCSSDLMSSKFAFLLTLRSTWPQIFHPTFLIIRNTFLFIYILENPLVTARARCFLPVWCLVVLHLLISMIFWSVDVTLVPPPLCVCGILSPVSWCLRSLSKHSFPYKHMIWGITLWGITL